MIAGRAVPTGFGLTVYSTPAVRIRIDYTNGKGTVSVYERVTVRASCRAPVVLVVAARGAGVGSIHDSPVEDPCPALVYGRDLRNTKKYAY